MSEADNLPKYVQAALAGEDISFLAYEKSNTSPIKFVVIGIAGLFSSLIGVRGIYLVYQAIYFGYEIPTISRSKRWPSDYHYGSPITSDSPILLTILGVVSVIFAILGIACLVTLISYAYAFFSRKSSGDESSSKQIIACIGTPTRLLRVYSSEIIILPWQQLSGRSRVIGKSVHLEKIPTSLSLASNSNRYLIISNLENPLEVEQYCRERIEVGSS